jgi:hypothetical protein
MATTNLPAKADRRAEPLELNSFVRIRTFLSPLEGRVGASAVAASVDAQPRRASGTDFAIPLDLSFPARIRKFLWLSSGLFSAACFAMPALGIFSLGAVETEGIGASFLVGIPIACLFGLTSLLRFGPEPA